MPILIGIVSSFIASIIYGIIIIILSKKFKKQLSTVMNRALGTGITYIYEDQGNAVEDILKCFKRSKIIKILTLRGKSFLSDKGALKFIIRDVARWQHIKFLIANPDTSCKPHFLKMREEELSKIDGQDPEVFISEIKQDIKILKNFKISKGIDCRLHNSPPVFRLIIFDKDAFVLYYSTSSRAADGRVYRCPSSSELYTSFDRYFDLIFNTSASNDSSGYDEI